MTVRWNGYRAGLMSDFADAIDRRIGPLDAVYSVTSGARSLAQEAALYAQGRTAPGEIVTWAKPGDSAHERGEAVDGVLVLPDGTETYNDAHPGWQEIIAAVRASPELHSGADFPKGESDPDHIERAGWRRYGAAPEAAA